MQQITRSKITIQLIFSSLVSFGIFSCGNLQKEDAQNEVFTLEATQPIKIDTSINNEYVADIHAMQNVEIRARVKGYLDKVMVDEGRQVKKGQTLFVINNSEYKTELLKSKAILEQQDAEFKAAEIELQNTRLLVEKKVISQNQLLIAKAKLEALKAKREEARAHVKSDELHVDFSTIKAPFDGAIDRIPFKPGSLIDEGSLLTTLSDTKNVFAYFNVNENEYLSFAKNNQNVKNEVPVSLKLSNGELYPHIGVIETIEAEIDKSTGNIAFRARFNNPEKLLKHGASGKIIMKKEVKNHWLIPQKSVFEIQERSYVFILNEQGLVEMKRIIPAYRIEHYYLIKDGFNKNDKILIEGIQTIKQGQKVNVKIIPIKQVINDLK